MSNPIDEETYGRPASDAPSNVQHGNPGRRQSDFDLDDPEPVDEPSDFRDGDNEVVPGTVAKTDAAIAAEDD